MPLERVMGRFLCGGKMWYHACMRMVRVILAWVLCVGSVLAHSPGVSTADIRVATNGIGVRIGFAPVDLQQLVDRRPLADLETQMCAVALDGVPLAPLQGGSQTDLPGDLRFAYVFPPVTAGLLRIECPLLRQLPEAHRQYLTIVGPGGELLAQRLLKPRAPDFSLDVTPKSPGGNLPTFVAAGQRRALSLAEQLALLGAVLAWGAAHAMTPGHGKAMVAAYLVGARSTPWHAVVLGLTVTATHTFGVFVLGFLTLFASHAVTPEKLYPWLAAASGLLVAVVGATMLIRRMRGAHHHDHDHSHTHDGHHHADHHHHDHHGHGHVHHHHDDHGHAHVHSHGHTHTHTDAVTWRQLLGLGVSGGLLPCPAALVLLLSSVSLQRTAFGLLLVLAFSLGLAGVLTLVGLLVVRGARILDRWPTFQRMSRVLPVVSAAVIFVIGVVLCVRAIPH